MRSLGIYGPWLHVDSIVVSNRSDRVCSALCIEVPNLLSLVKQSFILFNNRTSTNICKMYSQNTKKNVAIQCFLAVECFWSKNSKIYFESDLCTTLNKHTKYPIISDRRLMAMTLDSTQRPLCCCHAVCHKRRQKNVTHALFTRSTGHRREKNRNRQ